MSVSGGPRTLMLCSLIAGTLVASGCERAAESRGEQAEWSPVLQAERQRPLTGRVFRSTPERIVRGERLAKGLLWCVSCHSPLDTVRPGHPPVEGREFSGRVYRENEDGRLVAPNLTPDPETGTGSWSDDMLARAIREGVGHDGRGIGLPMDWEKFRSLSDEDVASVVVYLRSLPPVRNELPERQLTVAMERARAAGARPLTEPVPEPLFSEPGEHGRYLVELGSCVGCHTAWGGDPVPGLGAGGEAITARSGDVVHSLNITPHETGIGNWSREDFRWVMRTGKGGTLHPVMPWTAFQHLSDEQLDAIYDVLRTMHPVHHVIANGVPPTRCPVCGLVHGLGSSNVAPDPILGRPLPVARARGYVGRYRREGQVFEVMLVDEELHLEFDDGALAPLLWQSGDSFMLTEGWSSPVHFTRGPDGAVADLLMTDVGVLRYARLPEPAP